MTETAAASRNPGKWLFWIFAVIGGFAAIAVIWLAIVVAGFSMRAPRNEPARLEAKGPAENVAVLDTGDVWGTDLVRITIGVGANDSNRGSYGSGPGADDRRNLILLNRVSGDSRRVLDDNHRHVLGVRFFPAEAGASGTDEARRYDAGEEPGDAKTPRPPLAFYLLRIRQAEGPLEDVLIGDLASGAQAFVLSGIDGVDRVWMLSPTRMAVLMREKRKLQYRVIDLPTLKVVTARPIEIG